MRALLLLLAILSVCSCRSLKQSLEETSDTARESMTHLVGQLDEVKEELIPIDSVIRRSLMTSIHSLNEDENYAQLDSLSAKFTNSLMRNLDSLGLENRISDLTESAKASLLNEDTQAELKELVSEVLAQATGDLKSSINDVINSIDTRQLSSRLLLARNNILSKGLADSLSSTVNHIIANLDIDTLRQKILADLLNQEFKDTIRSVVNAPVTDIAKTGTGFLDAIRRYAGRLLLGVLGVAAAIIYLIFKFRRKNYKDISVLLMREIEKGGDTNDIKELKARVKKAAAKRDLEKDIQETLIQENLI